jgi:hypothetical protein
MHGYGGRLTISLMNVGWSDLGFGVEVHVIDVDFALRSRTVSSHLVYPPRWNVSNAELQK